jgi:hypothetical protein
MVFPWFGISPLIACREKRAAYGLLLDYRVPTCKPPQCYPCLSRWPSSFGSGVLISFIDLALLTLSSKSTGIQPRIITTAAIAANVHDAASRSDASSAAWDLPGALGHQPTGSAYTSRAAISPRAVTVACSSVAAHSTRPKEPERRARGWLPWMVAAVVLANIPQIV